MRRREFITLLGGAAIAWPPSAGAQQPSQMKRIGVLMGLPKGDLGGQSEFEALVQALDELGWREDHNVSMEVRWSTVSADQIAMYVKELVRLRCDVVIGRGTPAVKALLRESPGLPIVFLMVADPIGPGFVQSLARPGGNVTGFTNFEASLGGKWLGLLKEIAPRVDRVAVVFNPDTAPYAEGFVQSVEQASHALGVKSITADVHNIGQIESVIASLGEPTGGGIVQIPDTFTLAHRDSIIEMAARHRVPAIYSNRFFTASNGLMAYAVDSREIFRRAAPYVDRILKGTKPANLPVEQPMKFELAINLKTAKALGLTVPPSLLARADEVIE
jgi:putative ABC transport system substrate-binding protein